MKFAFPASIIQTELNERKERENEKDNIRHGDVDDMIFGSTKQIISER